MSELHLTKTETEDGKVVLRLADETGAVQHTVRLDTSMTLTLISALGASFAEATKNQTVAPSSVGLHHVQYQEVGETLFFRVFVTEALFHEYRCEANSTLGLALKAFADRYDSEELVLAMRQSPGQTKN